MPLGVPLKLPGETRARRRNLHAQIPSRLRFGEDLRQQHDPRREHPVARRRIGRPKQAPHAERSQRLARGRERAGSSGRRRRVERAQRGRHVCALGAARVQPRRGRGLKRRAGGVHQLGHARQCHLQRRDSRPR